VIRAGYRLRQMLAALRPSPDADQLSQAGRQLPPAQWQLFKAMPAAEQAHGLRVLDRLQTQGEHNPDLLAAGLLHDVGKSLHPLAPWERALAVLGRRLAPTASWRWGAGPPHGWRRPFCVARQHPAWGAELVAATGASAALVELIRRHQVEPSGANSSETSTLLRALQAADDWS